LGNDARSGANDGDLLKMGGCGLVCDVWLACGKYTLSDGRLIVIFVYFIKRTYATIQSYDIN
jgi:hypothetical protein